VKAGLKWTGHALVDVGVAGICVHTNRREPEDVTLEDLDEVSEFLTETYYQKKLGTYLTCVFMNASFVQPKEKAEKRKEFYERYLRAHRAGADPAVAGQRCVFSGLPATSPLVRTHLPLFSGEGVMNFRPDGTTWVPVAGPFVVAIFFLPMASRRSEGKLLCVHAENTVLLRRFARRNLEHNRRLIALALPATKALTHAGYDHELPSWDATKKRYKYADAKGPRSIIIADLTEMASKATGVDDDISPLTAYLVSNSGQGPSLGIFDVPGGVVSFVARASGASTKHAWQAVTRRFRPVKGTDDENGLEKNPAPKKRKGGAESLPPGRPGWSKNPAFEDLCSIYESGFLDRTAARRWLARYVLGRIRPDDPATRIEGTNARTWALAELFLKEVLAMKQGRIDSVKAFADKIAEWIRSKNDKALYRSLVMDKPSELRRALMRAQRESATTGRPIFGLDEYATVWLHEEGDEWLVRDLVCIRAIERLAHTEFLGGTPDLLPENLTNGGENKQ
jgi:CRISPR-associated protein Cst1